MRNVIRGDDSYWDAMRPYTLTERERGIYQMVDQIQEQPLYKTTYQIARTLGGNYYEVKPWKVEFGRWGQTFAYDDIEGFRVQLGGRTLKEFSQKFRFTAHLAYGFKDRELKGDAQMEFMLKREITRKLTVGFKQDYARFGSGTVTFISRLARRIFLCKNHRSQEKQT